MRLLRLSEVEVNADDSMFYYSRIRAALLALAIGGMCAEFVILGHTRKSWICYYVAALGLFLFSLLRRYITARFRPSNWLVRMTSQGLYVKFRSYLNYHLPDSDRTVVFLSYPDIQSVRLVRQRIKVTDSRGHPATQTLRFVELELRGDSTALASALETEVARPAPGEKRCYGSTATLYRHYPVRMVFPSLLQVRWSVVPSSRAFLDVMRPFATIAPSVKVSDDFTNLNTLTREQQEQRLRELDASGETIAAIYTARRLYGCGLTEATALVDGLRRENLVGS